MYSLRRWSVRRARSLAAVYAVLENALVALDPLFRKVGYRNIERLLLPPERVIKRLLFDSKSCGQCTLGSTGMVCPMTCPKRIRNGPCGGVRSNGNCEVQPQMPCVWVEAWEGSQRIDSGVEAITVVQSPLDTRLKGSSAWLRAARQRFGRG